MNLRYYVNEIYDIANANGAPIPCSVDMFLTNISNSANGSLIHYTGADHINYVALKMVYNDLKKSKEDFVHMTKSAEPYITHMRSIGDREKLKDFCVNYAN